MNQPSKSRNRKPPSRITILIIRVYNSELEGVLGSGGSGAEAIQYMVELAHDERDELEAVLKSSTRRAVSATKLAACTDSAGRGAGSDDGSGAQISAVASGAEEGGRGAGSVSGSGGLFGATGRPRSVDREDADGRAGPA